MPSPRRRAKFYTGALTAEQRAELMHGVHPSPEAPFASLAAARAAWGEHGALLTAEVVERSHGQLVPWAAVRWDGATGHSSLFCGIGDPLCACRRGVAVA